MRDIFVCNTCRHRNQSVVDEPCITCFEFDEYEPGEPEEKEDEE